MTVFDLPGLRLTDHVFTVPLDHDRPDGERIDVFAREVTAPGADAASRPWLLYLEGGPGCAAPRPLGREAAGGWIGRAARDYRVLLMDQRGTGRSTPANRQTLTARGSVAQQAEYLSLFRADAIVRDAEVIRTLLTGGAPWSILGQSFGGHCAVTYLSFAPGGLREVFITGGLPGLETNADAVYRAAYPRMQDKNALYYARHPGDVQTARRIAELLRGHEALLPNGALLTAEAFQSLGILLGSSEGSTRLHYLLEEALITGAGGRPVLSDAFQEHVQTLLSFAARPLYAVLHEATYAQDAQPTAWAAERIRAEFPVFDPDQTLSDPHAPLLFTGETMHPWQFRTDPALRPLRDTAHALAQATEWTPLYDPGVLAANQVPTTAVVYQDDLYVDTAHSLVTGAAIGGARVIVTDDHHHDGLAAAGTAIWDLLQSTTANAMSGAVPA